MMREACCVTRETSRNTLHVSRPTPRNPKDPNFSSANPWGLNGSLFGLSVGQATAVACLMRGAAFCICAGETQAAEAVSSTK